MNCDLIACIAATAILRQTGCLTNAELFCMLAYCLCRCCQSEDSTARSGFGCCSAPN